MRIFDDRHSLRSALTEAHADSPEGSPRVGLVPTMGYLHDGHISLMEAAREECDLVVLTLFVNPRQFGEGEDLDRYPRDLEGDLAKAERARVDFVYSPPVEDLYPSGFATHVEVEGLTNVLCGAADSRGSDHFRGVTTVVAKLLNLVDPDVAYFGQKDAQQAIVIERMATDLDFATKISVQPTVRDADGLALSSRNAYLTPSERERAPAIRRALLAATSAAQAGEPTSAALHAARQVLAEAAIEPEYLQARDIETLEEIDTFNGRPVLIAAAAPLGKARLIDNVIAEKDESSNGYIERNAAR